MNQPVDPTEPADPVTGEPLLAPPVVDEEVVAPFDRPDSGPVPPVTAAPVPAPDDVDEGDSDGSKVKGAALLAGAAALANKVRQEAPKKVQELREKRAAGRCVILTEADGRSLAIGPYKNEDAAGQDLFRVGGTARVVELVSETAFFDHRDTSHG